MINSMYIMIFVSVGVMFLIAILLIALIISDAKRGNIHGVFCFEDGTKLIVNTGFSVTYHISDIQNIVFI